MSNLHIRNKHMAISGINPLNPKYFQEFNRRLTMNNPNIEDRYLLGHKNHLQSLDQNRYEHSKSPLVYQSQGIKTSLPAFYKKKVTYYDVDDQRGRKNQINILISKNQTINETSNLYKQGQSPHNKTLPVKNKINSLKGQSGSLNQETQNRSKQLTTDSTLGRRCYLQQNCHHSHHVSPMCQPNRTQKIHRTQFHSTSNSPNELLKHKNLNFLRTLKLKRQQNNSYKQLFKTEQIITNQAEKAFVFNSSTPGKEPQKYPYFNSYTNQHQNLHSKSPIQSRNQEQKMADCEKHIDSYKRKTSIQDFQLLEKLGKGTLGEVFKARQKYLGIMCVIKKISKKKIRQLKLQQMIVRQIKLQSYLNNGHCTTIYGYFHDQDFIYLILELLPDASLQHVKKKRKLPQEEAIFIIHQVAEGLKYLHSENVIHRDLKPENIFMYEDYIKIGDFGCSIYHNQDGLRNSVVGSLEYLSPEQLFHEGYTEKIDSWSLGILTYELLYGKSPFQKQIKQILYGQGKDLISQINFPQAPVIRTEAKSFIRSLLKKNPEERMTMDQALAHPFLSDIEKE